MHRTSNSYLPEQVDFEFGPPTSLGFNSFSLAFKTDLNITYHRPLCEPEFANPVVDPTATRPIISRALRHRSKIPLSRRNGRPPDNGFGRIVVFESHVFFLFILLFI